MKVWSRFLIISLLALAGAIAMAPAAYAQDEDPGALAGIVVQVRFADQEDVNRLAAVYDIWQVDHGTRTATVFVTPAQFHQLESAGYAPVVDSERTQKWVQLADLAVSGSRTAGGVPGYACYRTVEETYTTLHQLADQHPELARVVDIGDSWIKVQGGIEESAGYDILALEVSNFASGCVKPTFFLMAAIHAREMTTAEVATRFAEQLVAGYGQDPDITWLLDHTIIRIVPHANPDGRKMAEGGLYWRKNRNDTDADACQNPTSPYQGSYGVDLNRNSSFKWGVSGSISRDDTCSQVYIGPKPMSEPETEALEHYMRSFFADQRGPNDLDPVPADAGGVMISLHSYSPVILFPWGWSATASPNDSQLRTLGRKFGYFTGYRVCQSGEFGCLYQTSGTTDDWAYGELGVASYTFELGTDFFQSCNDFETTILTGTLDALTFAAKVARQPYQLPAGPEIVTATVSITATAQPTQVVAGTPMTLTVRADDSRRGPDSFGAEPVEAIQAVRYTHNAPSWLGDTPAAMGPADGAFDTAGELAVAVVDTTGWAPGRHLLLVEAQDAAGDWGPPTGVFVDIALPGATAPPVLVTADDPVCHPFFLPVVSHDGSG
ncbi:MAG: peptidase M14 [Caldilineaceae bacterium]|nr:peptidase M14 [Caldilineaceae bacterium]